MLDLIRVVHDATGHCGARTTTQHLSHLFTWPGLHEDCYKFCQSCDHCQLHADIAAPTREPRPFDLYGPFEHVIMDSTGPFLIPQVVPAGLNPSSPGQPARKA